MYHIDCILFGNFLIPRLHNNQFHFIHKQKNPLINSRFLCFLKIAHRIILFGDLMYSNRIITEYCCWCRCFYLQMTVMKTRYLIMCLRFHSSRSFFNVSVSPVLPLFPVLSPSDSRFLSPVLALSTQRRICFERLSNDY